MAKLSFPTNPSVNDIYTQDGVSYQWDGSKWTANNDTALTLDAILTNGSSTTQTLTTGAITSPTAAKAWVNFDGTGTVAIRDSFNVSSITDNGTGDYTVNFTNAMSDGNYAICATRSQNGNTNPAYIMQVRDTFNPPTSSGFTLTSNGTTGGTTDSKYVFVTVFGS